MAKKKPRARRSRRRPEVSVETAELSLEEILEEYRSRGKEASGEMPEYTADTAAEDAPGDEVTLPETENTENTVPERAAEEAPPAPEIEPDDTPAPDEEAALEAPAALPEAPVRFTQMREQAIRVTQERRYPAVDTEHTSSVPLSDIEKEDDDDFYTGIAPEPEAPQPQDDESKAAGAEDADENPSEEEEEPAASGKSLFARRAASRRPRRTDGGPIGKIAGRLAAASLRSEQFRNQPPPDPEDPETEMEPRKAARHYAGQMPSIRLRAIIAGAVCLLLVWITLSCGFDWPLPGGLEHKDRAAALVCLAGQITIMLLSLDVFTSGVMSVLRVRPGAESLIVLAGLAALADTAAVAITDNMARGLPYTVLSSAAAVFALWGAWLNGRGFYDSFMTCFRIKDPIVVTRRTFTGLDEPGVLSAHGSSAGFIRRSEEPGPAESLAGKAFLPVAGASLLLSLLLSAGSGDAGAFFHIFSLLTGLGASFGWLLFCPLLFSRAARHLMYNGAAVAGWFGAGQMGESGCLVLTDKDIFPVDTVEITGIRVLNKADVRRVISATGSMLSAAGTGTAPVFSELMRQQEAQAAEVEDFAVGEGGARGTVDGAEVRVGTAGFMHLSGVKIPDRLRENNALFTALNGELAGVFLLNYRPTAGVQRALYVLRKGHRRPVFAVRDFNIDPMLVQREFDVSTEGFRFPTFPERYAIDTAADESVPPAGLLGQEGLEAMVELYETGRTMHRCGRLSAASCLAGAVIGAALAVAPCWSGNWGAVSAARVLLYMLAWLLPGFACRALLKK